MRKRPIIWWVSLAVSFGMIATAAFACPLYNHYRGAVLVELLFFPFLLLVGLVWSVVYFVRHRREPKAAVPGLLLFLSGAAAFWAPLQYPYEVFATLSRRAEMEEFVQVVNSEGLVELPPKYRHLSRTGLVWVWSEGGEKSVLFEHCLKFMFRAEGPLYSPSGQIPNDLPGHFVYRHHISGPWYWIQVDD